MTTLHRVDKKCMVCGKKSEYVEIGSTNQFGASDLDTRPPEMMRSTMSHWVQHCPNCGYCMGDVSQGSEKAAQVVHSAPYRAQLSNPDYPTLANSFLCSALICEADGNLRSAVWQTIHAAWACDDDRPESAAACRLQAIERHQRMIEAGTMLLPQVGADEVVIVDLLRRAGDFDLATVICDVGLSKTSLDKLVRKLLEYQKALCAVRDTERHTMDKAAEFGAESN